MKVTNPSTSPVQSGRAQGAQSTKDTREAKKADHAAAVENQAKIKSNENTDISPKSKEFAQAKSIAANTPDVREDRVMELKKRIAEDSYPIDENAIADKLVNEHLKMSGMT